HITPSRLGVKFCRWLQATSANIATTQIRNLSIPALASTTRLDSSSQTLATSHFQRSRAGLSANAISSLSVRDSSSCSDGGSGRTRTTDLTLIRGALYPPELQTRKSPDSWVSVVEPVGIEPTTPCLQSRCSPS